MEADDAVERTIVQLLLARQPDEIETLADDLGAMGDCRAVGPLAPASRTVTSTMIPISKRPSVRRSFASARWIGAATSATRSWIPRGSTLRAATRFVD
jgi:hypothetical protein